MSLQDKNGRKTAGQSMPPSGRHMSNLSIGNYLLNFRIEEDCLLPPATGSMWRGLLGHELQRMSTGEAAAPTDLPCWISRTRLYEYFIQTPPPPDTPAMRRYPHVPHPYAFAMPLHEEDVRLPANTHLELRIALFGKANELLNVAILALVRAAAGGLGKWRARASLLRVTQLLPGGESRHVFAPGEQLRQPVLAAPEVPPAPTTAVRLRLLTPLRLQHQGRLMKPETFSPQALLMNLVRRHSMLHLFHGPGELQADFRALKSDSQKVRLVDADLRWQRLARYSARQKQSVPLDGIIGSFVLDISQAPDLWPFLWLGQFTHAGKGTVFGLGQLKVET